MRRAEKEGRERKEERREGKEGRKGKERGMGEREGREEAHLCLPSEGGEEGEEGGWKHTSVYQVRERGGER